MPDFCVFQELSSLIRLQIRQLDIRVLQALTVPKVPPLNYFVDEVILIQIMVKQVALAALRAITVMMLV